MNADKIPVLTEAERDDLDFRLQETVRYFKRLRASALWNIQTFSVGDLASELTTRQALWLTMLVGLFTRIDDEAKVRTLPIHLPADLEAGPGEMFNLIFDHPPVLKDDYEGPARMQEMAPLLFKRLVFSKVKVAPQRAA